MGFARSSKRLIINLEPSNPVKLAYYRQKLFTSKHIRSDRYGVAAIEQLTIEADRQPWRIYIFSKRIRVQSYPIQLVDLVLIELSNWRWSWRSVLVVGTVVPLFGMIGLSIYARDWAPRP